MIETISYTVPFLAVAALIGISFYIIMSQRNLIKLVMGVSILASSVNLFLITLGYREGAVAPIYTHAPKGAMALPVPQALTLTSIVIAVGVLALMLSLVIRIYRHTGSTDSEESRKMRG